MFATFLTPEKKISPCKCGALPSFGDGRAVGMSFAARVARTERCRLASMMGSSEMEEESFV